MQLIHPSSVTSYPAVLRLTWQACQFETYCHHASIEIRHAPTLFPSELARIEITAYTAKVNSGKVVGGYFNTHIFHFSCTDDGSKLIIPLNSPDAIDESDVLRLALVVGLTRQL